MQKLNSGLNLRILPTKLPQKRPAARLAAFDEDNGSDQPEATARGKTIEIANVNHQLRQLDPSSNRNITELKRKAQEEDSTIFEYDAVYDQMKQAEKQQLAMLQGKAEERKVSKQSYHSRGTWKACSRLLSSASAIGCWPRRN